MPYKSAIHAFSIALLPFLILISGYCLVTERYFSSLASLLVIVLLMETRVRMGYRRKRDALFYIHLACGVGLLVALVLLSTRSAPSLVSFAGLLFIGMTLTGIVLVKNSWQRLY